MAHSKAQRAHAHLSMAKINGGNKENDISSFLMATILIWVTLAHYLVEAIEWHNDGERAVILPTDENTIQVDVLSDLDEKELDWE